MKSVIGEYKYVARRPLKCRRRLHKRQKSNARGPHKSSEVLCRWSAKYLQCGRLVQYVCMRHCNAKRS